jgi:alkylation response protein AidB-like acyl-CoA dehydrogenase
MDFELSPEQKEIKKAAKEFAEGEFDKEIAFNLEKEKKFPYEIWKKACNLGFMGIHFPQEYGGQGYGLFENVLVIEEFCRKDSGIGSCLMMVITPPEIIVDFGTEKQKQNYVIPAVKGEKILASAFTEPQGGSDITRIATRAEKKGDKYIINGSKTLISHGSILDAVLLLCQTDPDAKPLYRGQSIILVEKERKGFENIELSEKMGIRMTSTAELFFNNVEVPEENLVGQENRGFYQALKFFNKSRIGVAAQALGIAQGAFDRAFRYTKEREAFGQKVFQFQAIQHKLAEMRVQIETARLLTYKAAWKFDQGKIDPQLISMAKYWSARTATLVADEAIEMFGGYGYFTENEVERFYRDARITELYEGTREIQKNLIAKDLKIE